MPAWLRQFASQFDLERTFTQEGRQQITLRYAIWFTLFVLVTLLPFQVLQWFKDRSTLNLFFIVNNLACAAALFLVRWLNNRHKTNRASGIFLIISSYLCFTAFPYQNADQILLYLVIPVSIASFISDGRKSLQVIFFTIPIFFLVYQVEFSKLAFPLFSILCLVLVAVISWQASKIIERILVQLTSAYNSTIEGWALALEMRNQETEGHSQRVVELTMLLAERMGVSKVTREHMQRGVLLHDIGKMGVPDSILCKRGPLDDAERRVMQKHPIYARDLLKNIEYLAPAINIPYNHHEKFDGTGYPRGIQGDAIPLEARIFSVVDVWDAMRSKRSYRDAIPENQVAEYLRSEKNRSFDPRVVDTFFSLMQIPIEPVKGKVPLSFSQQPQKARY